MTRLLHFVRAHVPRSMTAVEEPGYHLKEGYAQCPHCEEVYSTDGMSDMCIELDCCPEEKCTMAAIGERRRQTEALIDSAAKWRKAEWVLRTVANLQPGTDELVQMLLLSNLRIAARELLGWCERCQARQAVEGQRVCRECRAIGQTEGFNG